MTDAGTVKSLIVGGQTLQAVPPVGAALDSVTVQEVLALVARLEAVQVREDRLTGASSEIVTGDELPLREAVIVALALAVIVPPLAVKLVDVAVDGTVTDAGTVKSPLLEDRLTAIPPVGAALDSVTVQEVLALVAKLEAVHVREDRLTGASSEMVTGDELPLREAVIVALAFAVIVPAVAVKLAVVAVAGTVTDAGTVKRALLEDRLTALPPVGAALDSVTVQEVLALVARLEAVQVREDRLTGASSEMVTGDELPLREAVIVALALEVIVPAVAVKLVVVAVAGTVTDAGTVKRPLLEDKLTAVPPVGAALDSVTVQEVLALVARLEAVHVREDRLTGASSEMVTGDELPLREAVIVALAFAVIVPAVAVKLAVVAVAGTVTEAGTVSFALLEDKLTAVPPVGAALDSVTVQEVLALVARLEAVHVREDRLTGASSEMVTGDELPLREAVIVALSLSVIVPAVAVKLAVVAVAGTVTDVGTVKRALLEDRLTAVPPVGAALDSVTVQEVLALEARLDAVHVRDDRLTGASSEMVTGDELPLREAVIVALALAVIVPAVAVKLAVVAVAGTVTDVGTVKRALLEDRLTAVPPVGGAALRDSVTVQEVLALEARLDAVHVRDDRLTGASSEMVTGDELPLSEAVIVALALEVIVPAVAVKLAVVAVARTVTDAGTAKSPLLDDRLTAGASGGRGTR